MATLLAQYLLNEGPGENTTLSDSSGNGNHLTLDLNGRSDHWSTLTNGSRCIYQGGRTTGISAVKAPCPTLYEGLTKLTMVCVLQDMSGYSSGVRGVFIGTDGGNGNIMFGNSAAAQDFDCRWNYELDGDSTGPDYSRVYRDPTDKAAMAVYIVEYNYLDAAASEDHLVILRNMVPEALVKTEGGLENHPSPADLAWAKFCLFNRPAKNSGWIGRYGYVEFWDGQLTAQEKQDATDALLLDCDEPWMGAPSTSVSFTQEPTSTAITEDSVTAQATAESDAP